MLHAFFSILEHQFQHDVSRPWKASLISLFWPSQFIALCTWDGMQKMPSSFDFSSLSAIAIPSVKCIIESLMIYPQLPNASARICFVFRLCFFTLKCQRCKHAASEDPKTNPVASGSKTLETKNSQWLTCLIRGSDWWFAILAIANSKGMIT